MDPVLLATVPLNPLDSTYQTLRNDILGQDRRRSSPRRSGRRHPHRHQISMPESTACTGDDYIPISTEVRLAGVPESSSTSTPRHARSSWPRSSPTASAASRTSATSRTTPRRSLGSRRSRCREGRATTALGRAFTRPDPPSSSCTYGVSVSIDFNGFATGHRQRLHGLGRRGQPRGAEWAERVAERPVAEQRLLQQRCRRTFRHHRLVVRSGSPTAGAAATPSSRCSSATQRTRECSASCGRRDTRRRLAVCSARRSSRSALGPAQRSRPCTRPSGSTRRSTSARSASYGSRSARRATTTRTTATSTAGARTTASRSTASPDRGPGTRLPDVHEPAATRSTPTTRSTSALRGGRIPRPGSVRTRTASSRSRSRTSASSRRRASAPG